MLVLILILTSTLVPIRLALVAEEGGTGHTEAEAVALQVRGR